MLQTAAAKNAGSNAARSLLSMNGGNRLQQHLAGAVLPSSRFLSTSTSSLISCIASTSTSSLSYSTSSRSLFNSNASTSKPLLKQPNRRSLSTSAKRALATPTDDIPPTTNNNDGEEGEEDEFDLSQVERASDQVDVCIVGGGPAGLSAAIRLMQLAKEKGNEDFRVVVLEKGGEVGGCFSNTYIYHMCMLHAKRLIS